MIDHSDYNSLEYLLLVYFNQDWIENSTNNHFTGIIAFVYYHEDLETSLEIVYEIDKLLSLELSERRLGEALRKLASPSLISPVPDRIYRDWLIKIRDTFQYMIDHEEHQIIIPWNCRAPLRFMENHPALHD